MLKKRLTDKNTICDDIHVMEISMAGFGSPRHKAVNAYLSSGVFLCPQTDFASSWGESCMGTYGFAVPCVRSSNLHDSPHFYLMGSTSHHNDTSKGAGL